MRLPKSIPQPISQPISQPSSAPAWQYAFHEGRDIFSIWGKNAQELFAVGDAGTLLVSKDAGKTWNKQILKDVYESLYSIWGKNDTIFIAGANGTLLRSRDAGKTWLPMKEIPEKDLFAVWGSSEDDIYVVGKNSTLLHATDGASFVAVPALDSAHLYGVHGSDANNVFVCGAKGLLLRSLDAGKTWETITTNVSSDLRSVLTNSKTEIHTIGYQPNQRNIPPKTEVLSSLDGGVSWKMSSHPGEGRTILADNNSLFAIGPYVSLKSSDRGATWTNWIAPNQHEALRQLYGLWRTPSHFLISGQRGLLLQTDQNANVIMVQSGSIPVTWYDSLLLQDQTLLASGWYGNLVRWKNDVIELIRTDTTSSLVGIGAIQEKILALGSDGVLLQSEDQGNSWKPAPNLKERIVQKAYAHTESNLMFALASDRILSSNNGTQWITRWSDNKKHVRAIAGAQKNWYLVGDDGLIAVSNNYTSWQKKESGTIKHLFSVAVCDQQKAIAFGADGTILYTSDQGETWVMKESQVSQDISVAWSNKNEVLISGDEGVVLFSSDCGESWKQLPTLGQEIFSLNADESFFYATGDGIMARFARSLVP